MLPASSTSRYGDLLREFYNGVKNNSLSEPRLDEIVRVFNELDQREAIYRSWLQEQRPNLENPIIGSPTWTKSPLNSYSFQMHTDLSVANNTKTFITFDTFYQHGNNFVVDETDQSKIIIVSPGLTFQVSGIVNWNNNATGYRYIALEGFKEDDTSLGFVGLHLFQGTGTEDNSFPVSYVADLAQLNDMKYMKFFLRQTSGGNLDCFQVLLAAFLV